MKSRNYLAAILLLLVSGVVYSQQAHVNLDWAPQRNDEGLTPFMANTVSPDVKDDHTVTFRVNAPEAKEILLSGSILLGLKSDRPLPFVIGENGVWSVTAGPLTPSENHYNLIIDR